MDLYNTLIVHTWAILVILALLLIETFSAERITVGKYFYCLTVIIETTYQIDLDRPAWIGLLISF